jgi:amino acid transporter
MSGPVSQLKREMGLFTLAIGVGSIMGSSVFTLPAVMVCGRVPLSLAWDSSLPPCWYTGPDPGRCRMGS